MFILSAPAQSGYIKSFAHLSDARWEAAQLMGITVDAMIEVDSPDGGTTYCYSSLEMVEADRDGAYAVQYRGVAD